MILLFLVYCSVSEDEIDMYELTEADGDLQIVTECWVEPQYGVVVNSTPERQHWEGLTYKQIARAVSHFLVYGIFTIWLHQDSLSINFRGFCGWDDQIDQIFIEGRNLKIFFHCFDHYLWIEVSLKLWMLLNPEKLMLKNNNETIVRLFWHASKTDFCTKLFHYCSNHDSLLM